MAKKAVEEKSISRVEDLINSVGENLKMKPVNLSRGKFVENTFSSGCLSLDLILGGGYGIGRWVSILGPAASGKSTLIATAMAVLQRMKCPQIVFDHEGSIDPVYAKAIGVVLHKSRGFFYLPADVGEHTFRFIRRTLKQLPDITDEQRKKMSKPRMVFFIDSIASMVAQAVDDDDEKESMAQQARMLSRYIPVVRSLLSIKGCTVLATNQIREAPMAFGNPEREPGGNAPQFYPDIRIRVGKHSAPKKSGGEKQESFSYSEEESLYQGGGIDRFIYTKARTLKNRQFAPFLDVEMRINLGRGIDPIQDAVSYLEMTGQLTGSAGNYRINMDEEDEIKVKGWNKLGRIVCTPEFRDKCREQMKSNKAFKMFFEIQRGRNIDDDEEKGEDPVAIYSLSDESDDDKKGKKRKKFKSTGRKIKEARRGKKRR